MSLSHCSGERFGVMIEERVLQCDSLAPIRRLNALRPGDRERSCQELVR